MAADTRGRQGSLGPQSITDTIVQFSAPAYFVEESEERLTIDVIRLGNHNCVTKVRYHTVDASALAGIKYEYTKGTVIFKEGEHVQSIEIRITQDETWSTTLEFKVVLEHCEGGILVPDGADCRVQIIDDDVFPSNKYRDELSSTEDVGHAVGSMPQWGLFIEYFWLNFGSPGMKSRTVAFIIFDQMQNMYLFFLLKARTYLVNVVFDTAHEETSAARLISPWPFSGTDLERRVGAARLVAVMYVLPMAALHIWSYIKLKLDIQGHSRVYLQTAIFRKYLNYNEASRSSVRVSHMQVALLSNTADLAVAYCAVLSMFSMIGKLILLMVFMLSQDATASWVLVVMPSMMLVFGICRSDALSRASEMAGPLKKVLIDITTETCAKYRLIADYRQRPQMNDLFAKRAEELRRCLIPEMQVELNNNYFPKWLGPTFNAVYIAFAAELVLKGELTLGVFLATLSVFSEVSGDFSSLYCLVMDVNTRLDSLKTLTKYFNLETEARPLMEQNRKALKATKIAWADALKKPSPPKELGLFRSDLIPITLQNLCFQYPLKHNISFKTSFELRDVNLRVSQGQMVAIVGPHGSGKGTFLRLLSTTIFPTEGSILIPTHLRVLYVAQLPVIFDRDPWYNMVFGRPDFKDPVLMQTLLKELEMDTTLDLVKNELESRQARKSIKKLDPKALKNLPGRLPDSKVSPKAGRGLSRELTVGVAVAAAKRLASLGGARTPGSPRGDYMELKELQELEESRSDCESDAESEAAADETGLLAACCAADFDQKEIKLDVGTGWQDMLSYTEQVKICLLRALLMNPEILVLHRPFHNFDAHTQQKVLNLLKHHRDNRGLGLPKSSWAHRRPRTIFFTPESLEQAQEADVIWQIDSDNKRIVEISREELRDGFICSTSKHLQPPARSRGEDHGKNLREQWQSPHVMQHDQQVASGRFLLPLSPSRSSPSPRSGAL